MTHHLHTLRITIVAALLLAGCFAALFVLEGESAGKATTSTTAFILNSTGMNCTFTADTGYNIISIPCLTTAVPITSVVNGTQIAAMYQYIPTGGDRWKAYNPNLPNYVVSDLQFLTRRAGYITIMDASANVSIEGLRAIETDIPLEQGWNLVGYPTNVTRNISASLAGILATTTRIEAYNKSAESFIFYPGGTLNDTVSGSGYWINSTAATTWTVDG